MKLALHVVTILGTIVGVIALILGIGLLFTFPLMWAINYVFTPSVLLGLFGAAKIGFWKTFVLAVIVGWLFKGNVTTTGKK